MSFKLYQLMMLAVAGLVLGAAGELAAADHQEAPFFVGSYYVTSADAVEMDRLLTVLGAEPVDPSDGPMPQTKEHILLARQVVPASRESDVEYLLVPFESRELLKLLLEDLHALPRDFVESDFLVRYSAIKTFPSEGR